MRYKKLSFLKMRKSRFSFFKMIKNAFSFLKMHKLDILHKKAADFLWFFVKIDGDFFDFFAPLYAKKSAIFMELSPTAEKNTVFIVFPNFLIIKTDIFRLFSLYFIILKNDFL